MIDSGAVTVQWGALVSTPEGRHAFEPHDNRHAASNAVHALNQARAGMGSLIYRQRVAGEWTTNLAGDEYAVRYRWEDGKEEIHPAHNRLEAEAKWRISQRHPDPTAEIVSRPVEYGQWWVADSERAA
ncbi:hypothetical protein ABZY58_11385 [Micromonospora tulbaghiae]|uniref:hypothetical protein n=1 Tax=Micromonospora tulbaghiae TaxID=479978 RepID=UPI0033B40CE8